MNAKPRLLDSRHDALGIFYPDPDERDNWCRTWSQSHALKPAQRLAAAVLAQAIDDAVLPTRRRYHLEARWWVFTDYESDNPFELESICYWLGIDADWIRGWLRREIRRSQKRRSSHRMR